MKILDLVKGGKSLCDTPIPLISTKNKLILGLLNTSRLCRRRSRDPFSYVKVSNIGSAGQPGFTQWILVKTIIKVYVCCTA